MKSLDDIREFKIEAFEDFRGEIYTTYEKKNFDMDFIHDKVTTRRKNCLVGIHGDFKTHKLVTCLYGEVYEFFRIFAFTIINLLMRGITLISIHSLL